MKTLPKGHFLLIDFDNSGYGSFTHDIAWTLTQLTSDLRHQFIETYAQTYKLPVLQTIEDYFILSQLYHLSWWVNDPGYDFHQIPSLCQHYEQRLSGTPFLFE
ncbi:MAG: hypothetical protein O2954_03365 [bacterium]|nr:hypothetical protein [bacterium]